MMSAMGTEPQLRIMRLLLSAHPAGLVVAKIGEELGIPGSTLSHHLEKLKNEDLVTVHRLGHLSQLRRQLEGLAGPFGVPVCGMLLAQQGGGARVHYPALQGLLVTQVRFARHS